MFPELCFTRVFYSKYILTQCILILLAPWFHKFKEHTYNWLPKTPVLIGENSKLGKVLRTMYSLLQNKIKKLSLFYVNKTSLKVWEITIKLTIIQFI